MLLQQLVNGVTLGAVYTLLALSFSIVMGILGILNLAIADLFMIGGYLGFMVITTNLPLPIAVAAGMAGAAVIFRGLEKVGYEPPRRAPAGPPMLGQPRLFLILSNVPAKFWGARTPQFS